MAVIEREGSFNARVISRDLAESSQKKPQVVVGFEVLDGDQIGKHITGYFSLSEAAYRYTVEKLRIMGWQGVDLADLSTVGAAGPVEIVCKSEEYNGKVSMKVQFVNAPGRSGVEVKGALDAAGKRALAQRMRGLIVGLDPGAVKKASPVPPPSDDTNSDISF